MARVNVQDVWFFGFDTARKRYKDSSETALNGWLHGHARRRFEDALHQLQERFGKRLAFALQERRLFAKELCRQLKPRRPSDVAVLEAAAKYEHVRAVQHLTGGNFEVLARSVEHRDVKRRLHEVQKRVALHDDVEPRAAVARFVWWRSRSKSFAEQRHPLGQVA